MYISLSTEDLADIKKAVAVYRDYYDVNTPTAQRFNDLWVTLLVQEEMNSHDPHESLIQLYESIVAALEYGREFPSHIVDAAESIGDYFVRVGTYKDNYVRNFRDKPWESEVKNLLKNNRKIAAIKFYRERTGAGLKDSKFVIDKIQDDMIKNGELAKVSPY